MAPNLPGFQGIKRCMQYLAINHHKPIYYPLNYYYVSNVIRLTWSGTQVEYYTTQNCLERNKGTDHAIIINIRRSVLGIIHTLLGVKLFWKIQIQPDVSSNSTDVKIRYMYKAVNNN